jgi:hypothetical protein
VLFARSTFAVKPCAFNHSETQVCLKDWADSNELPLRGVLGWLALVCEGGTNCRPVKKKGQKLELGPIL